MAILAVKDDLMDGEIRYNRIQHAIFDARIEQQDLAEMLGVATDTVSRWCINKHQPSLRILFKIAEILRMKVLDLIEPADWSKAAGPSPIDRFKEEKEKRKAEAKIKLKKKSSPKKKRHR